ncbi:hypothetical protein [Fimbriiglobus ruber]|uniref:Uncharacterized protein n=1 Tax=Fimbriiglobus ruber TaxID=1908690 RepID=A0A225EAQ7_9BACT|nr:hypothetical protein [Fimbriiglobus ruber]OWK45487.1 hypothetical protein FRUB_01818 [Fimbriiglobus ruber]
MNGSSSPVARAWNPLFAICLGLVGFSAGGIAPAGDLPGSGGDLAANVKKLKMPGVLKIVPYIVCAAQCQKMGKEKACEQLAKIAKTVERDNGEIAILCRLLFTNKPKQRFRGPGLGEPVYYGGTKDGDWPSILFEFVDDVPLCVIHGYNLQGHPESSADYLKYCLENCDWSERQFDGINQKDIEAAFTKLWISNKWKKQLTEYERKELRFQIE